MGYYGSKISRLIRRAIGSFCLVPDILIEANGILSGHFLFITLIVAFIGSLWFLHFCILVLMAPTGVPNSSMWVLCGLIWVYMVH